MVMTGVPTFGPVICGAALVPVFGISARLFSDFFFSKVDPVLDQAPVPPLWKRAVSLAATWSHGVADQCL